MQQARSVPVRRALRALARRASPLALLLPSLLAFALSLSFVTPTAAQIPTVTVRVTLVSYNAIDCDDGLAGDPEIYFRLFIDGISFAGDPDDYIENDEATLNREYFTAIDFTRGSIPIQIEMWDNDGGLTFDDDHCDIDPGGDSNLNLTLNLDTCALTGDLTNTCAVDISSTGNNDERSRLTFRVQVDEPPQAPGLQVRCLHNPLWPQPGQTVTVTVEALDDNRGLIPLVDRIEIWVDNTNAAASISTPGLNTWSFTAAPAMGATSMLYRCRVEDNGLAVSSGWRQVQIGNPPVGRAVPVVYTGVRGSRVDIVFIPDSDNYTGTNDPAFLNDIRTMIDDGYYDENVFLQQQQNLNFWLAQDMGNAERNAAGDCILTAPGNWNTEYIFAESGPIVHTNVFRDCASGRLFSTENTSLRTMLHETGHSPFGLPDEYCCDGGYWEPNPLPTLYDTLNECINDLTNLGRAGGTCRSYTDNQMRVWYTSEPASTDLMVDNQTPQAADLRRINWLFQQCSQASC